MNTAVNVPVEVEFDPFAAVRYLEGKLEQAEKDNTALRARVAELEVQNEQLVFAMRKVINLLYQFSGDEATK